MKHEILYKPSYAMLKVELEPGDEVLAEAGAMVAMGPTVAMKTSVSSSIGGRRGIIGRFFSFIWGLFGALIRKLVGGESFFINRFRSEKGTGEVLLAPAMVGDIIHHRLENESLTIQSTSFLAASPTIKIETVFAGLWGFLSGEGLFMLRCTGAGDVWVNAYGMVDTIELDGRMTIDSGHLVAFDSRIKYHAKTVGGLKSTLFSGEGLVVEVEGKGKVYTQSRSLDGLVNWISPLLP